MVMHLRSSPSSVIGKISCATGKYASGSFREGLKCVSHSRSAFAFFAIRAASEKSMCQCIAQFFGGKALDRLGARPVALIGSITLLFGTIMMSLISMTSWIWWVSIWQFVRQIGMGFVLMPITTWSLNCLEPEEVSAGSAVTNTVRQIAGAIGAPVLVILMETFTALRWAAIGGAKNMYAVANVFGIQWALRVSATICFIMVVMVFFGVRGNGAGSTRDTVQRALNRVHPHAA